MHIGNCCDTAPWQMQSAITFTVQMCCGEQLSRRGKNSRIISFTFASARLLSRVFLFRLIPFGAESFPWEIDHYSTPNKDFPISSDSPEFSLLSAMRITLEHFGALTDGTHASWRMHDAAKNEMRPLSRWEIATMHIMHGFRLWAELCSRSACVAGSVG